jgi:MFS family permease
MAFFILDPIYLCFDKELLTFSHCPKSQACELSFLPSNETWVVDYDSIYTLRNWITSLEMYCSSSFEVGLLGTSFFIG